MLLLRCIPCSTCIWSRYPTKVFLASTIDFHQYLWWTRPRTSQRYKCNDPDLVLCHRWKGTGRGRCGGSWITGNGLQMNGRRPQWSTRRREMFLESQRLSELRLSPLTGADWVHRYWEGIAEVSSLVQRACLDKAQTQIENRNRIDKTHISESSQQQWQRTCF